MPTQNNEFNQYVNAYNTARNDTVSTKYFNIGLNNVLDFFGAGRPLQEYVIKQRPLKEYYPMHKYCKAGTIEKHLNMMLGEMTGIMVIPNQLLIDTKGLIIILKKQI